MFLEIFEIWQIIYYSQSKNLNFEKKIISNSLFLIKKKFDLKFIQSVKLSKVVAKCINERSNIDSNSLDCFFLNVLLSHHSR